MPTALATDIYRDIELPLVPVLASMEARGIRLDTIYLARLEAQMNSALALDEEQLALIAHRPLNPRSPKQLGSVFYGSEGLDEPVRRRTKTGRPSTDRFALQMMQNSVARAVEQCRETSQSLSLGVRRVPQFVLEDGRIHPSFHQAGTWEEGGSEGRPSPETGRLSSSGPNVQQVTVRRRWGRVIRQAFVPTEGYVFVAADASQEELRLASWFANERALRDAFEGGSDPHQLTAVRLGLDPKRQRDIAKNCNFALIYGVAAPKLLAMVPELGDLRSAIEIRERFFDTYRAFPIWWAAVLDRSRAAGYSETYFGRRRYLPFLGARKKADRAEAERQAINHTVQGTGADVLKFALRRVWEATRVLDAHLVLTSHDDIVLETRPSLVPTVCDILRGAFQVLPLSLPAEIKVGKTWGDMEAYGLSKSL